MPGTSRSAVQLDGWRLVSERWGGIDFSAFPLLLPDPPLSHTTSPLTSVEGQGERRASPHSRSPKPTLFPFVPFTPPRLAHRWLNRCLQAVWCLRALRRKVEWGETLLWPSTLPLESANVPSDHRLSHFNHQSSKGNFLTLPLGGVRYPGGRRGNDVDQLEVPAC